MQNRLVSSFLILVLFWTVSDLIAQPRSVGHSNDLTINANRHEVVDISFKLKRMVVVAPFDLAFGANVYDEAGQAMDIHGFYNGDNEWLLRFSSGKTGKFRFETYSSQRELSGLKGIIIVDEAAHLGKHGAIIIDPEKPQYFSYEDGEAYFGIIFELDWLFALDAKNPTGIPRTRQVVKDIKDNGFNQVVMNVYAYESSWPKSPDIPENYDYRRPRIFPWLGTNENPDYSALNTRFFKHLDRVIYHLDSEQIIAHLMIYVWNKKVNWPDMYSKADNTFFDYVIKRYQAFPNIIWDVSKEALDYGRCDIEYINDRINRIRRLDSFNRLLTVHDYEYNSREAHRVDFISIQSWRPNLYNLMLQTRAAHPDKPVVNIEHGGYEKGPYLSFEGNFIEPEQCLIRAYECVFAGVYPSYYWQNAAWDIIIYDALDEKHDFDPPRYDYYNHMAGFFERYNYNELFPIEQKLTINSREEMENLSSGGIPLTNGDDLFLFLVPGTTYQINTVLPKPDSGKISFTWFNIFTGEYTTKRVINWSGWQAFQSPWKNTTSILVVRYQQQ
jgi:hypothetical protein